MAKYCKAINANVNAINEKIWSTDCMFLHLLIISLWMYSMGNMHEHITHMKVRGQPVGSLLPPFRASGLNSSHQAWRQVF